MLCKREMIYRDLGLGTREALALHSNNSHQVELLPPDQEVGRHPAQFSRLGLRLEPSEGAQLVVVTQCQLSSRVSVQASMISGGSTKYTTSW